MQPSPRSGEDALGEQIARLDAERVQWAERAAEIVPDAAVRAELIDVVAGAMIDHGPDGHTDGCEAITNALLASPSFANLVRR